MADEIVVHPPLKLPRELALRLGAIQVPFTDDKPDPAEGPNILVLATDVPLRTGKHKFGDPKAWLYWPLDMDAFRVD